MFVHLSFICVSFLGFRFWTLGRLRVEFVELVEISGGVFFVGFCFSGEFFFLGFLQILYLSWFVWILAFLALVCE